MNALTALTALAALVGSAPPPTGSAPRDAFVIVTASAGLDEALLEVAAEAVLVKVSRARGVTFLDRGQVLREMGYQGHERPGSCAFRNDCLREVQRRLGVRWLVVARVRLDGQELLVEVTRLGAHAGLDLLRAARVPWTPSALINRLAALLPEVMVPDRARLMVSVNVTGADVAVDGRARGSAPLTLDVAPGVHAVRITRPGFAPFEVRVTCEARTPCVVPGVLVPEAGPPGGERGLIVAGWSTLAAGVLLAALGGGITGAEAASKRRELDRGCSGTPCALTRDAAERIDAARSDAERSFTILTALGGTMAAAGLVTAIVGHVRARRAPTRARVTPLVSPRGDLGASLSVTF